MIDGRHLGLHEDQGREDLLQHLIDFGDGQTEVAFGVAAEVFAIEQFHKGVEQALVGLAVVNELDDVVVLQVFKCLELVDGFGDGSVLIEDLHSVELVLDEVLGLEDTTKATFAQLFIKHQLGRDVVAGLQVFEVGGVGRCCLVLAFQMALDEVNQLVGFLPTLILVECDGVANHIIRPFGQVLDDMRRQQVVGEEAKGAEGGSALERQLIGEQLIENDTEGIEVAGG